ncbi:uncharacterized protein [Maniola hyperantus]|uniref:uncharacterized protein n=1 Tax=Aphantopus hyperantus TaxID=2795564 RepID=UPI001569C85B|nr:uncharacterized protein LOC117996476 [Maniola hyperantus]
MSEIRINKTCKQRFKGVEHFLRRVAFNLGNTPSQTEVKIISCIPVDVTDLQAKIQFLERQLQETGKYPDKISKSKTAAQVTPPLGSLKGGTEIDKVGATDTKGATVSDRSGAVEKVHCGCRVGETNGVVGKKNSAVSVKNGAKDNVVGDKGGAVERVHCGCRVEETNGVVGKKNGVVSDKNGNVSGKNCAKNNVVDDKDGAVERVHCSCVVNETNGEVGKKNGAVGHKNGTVSEKNGAKDNVVGDKGRAVERVHCSCRVGQTNGAVGKKNGAVGNKYGILCDKNCAKDNVVCDKGGAVNAKNGAVANKSSNPNTGSTVVNAILYGGSYANQSKTIGYSSDKSLRSDRSRYKPSYSGSEASRHRKSNVSFVLPVITTENKEEQPYCSTSSYENNDLDNPVRNIAEAERKLAAAERYYNKLFKKSKRTKKFCKGKREPKTHLVYIAQHIGNNPFNANVSLDLETLNNKTVSLSHAYLDNVIRKQYDPKFVVQEFSDTSHFSRPICRDTSDEFARSRLYESDVCSCCHGRFQNIDNYMPKGFDFINKLTQCEPNYTNKTYYDSNLYDVVPVKENTNKPLKEGDSPKRGIRDIEIRCWPEQFRSKYRHDPKTAKYHAETHLKRRDNLTAHKLKLEQCKVEQKRINKQVHEASKVAPKTCYIDVNRNDTFPSAKVKKSEPVKKIVLKNESIDTDDLNTSLLLNNQSTQLELIPDDNKTESTLNQIKSILQSVLAEVKTNSKVNDSTEKKLKRDAVVQKGASQNNMQGQSTLLHSFTYNNSYNANPYLPSCSQQHSAGQYCLAGTPYQPSIKYLQNFPVFVQTSSGRRLCACHYKNSSHKPSKYKQASAAATNTDKERTGEIQKNDGNKETEKLIKEIYKSMAATMDFPTKENSVSEYGDVKSTKSDFITESNVKDVRSAGTVVDKRDIEVEALLSSNVSSNSKLVYNTSIQPKYTTQTIEERHCDKSTSNETNHEKILHRFERSAETILEADEETDTSSDDTEDEDIVEEFETPPKHERKGLLQRMFNSVKMFNRRKVDQKSQNESEVSGTSDSDDYETIYSGRTAVLQRKTHRQSYQHQAYTKGILEDQNALRSLHEKGKRSPYLEQEYRRQWNERLMFDKQQERRYSSERPLSKQLPLQNEHPAYWNTYDARTVLVDSKRSPIKYVNSKANITDKLKRGSFDELNGGTMKDKRGWFKKHKVVNCGEQWKKFVLEN